MTNSPALCADDKVKVVNPRSEFKNMSGIIKKVFNCGALDLIFVQFGDGSEGSFFNWEDEDPDVIKEPGPSNLWQESRALLNINSCVLKKILIKENITLGELCKKINFGISQYTFFHKTFNSKFPPLEVYDLSYKIIGPVEVAVYNNNTVFIK